jgi:hypothetical protein
MSAASAIGSPIQHPHETTGGEVSGSGTTAAMNFPVPIPSVTSTVLVLGIVNSFPHVASGGCTTAATNSPVPDPVLLVLLLFQVL